MTIGATTWGAILALSIGFILGVTFPKSYSTANAAVEAAAHSSSPLDIVEVKGLCASICFGAVEEWTFDSTSNRSTCRCANIGIASVSKRKGGR